MNSVKLPEQGYTPNNYIALVELTSLTNADFCREFNIPEQTFYKHRLGSRTMKWKEWRNLYNTVIDFIESTLVWYFITLKKIRKN